MPIDQNALDDTHKVAAVHDVSRQAAREIIEAYLAARKPEATQQPVARTIDQMSSEGNRTKAEEWEACYAGLLAQVNEMNADHHRLVRELDVALNGEEGAARQASLCDIVSQVKANKRESSAVALLKRWVETAKSGNWRDGAHLSIQAHPVFDATLEYIRGSE